MSEREITIRISAKNLSEPEFAKARAAVAGLSTESKGFSDRISGLIGGPLKALGPALVAGFGAGAVVAAGKKVLDFADNMVNLSAKTGIGTTGLQKLDLAFAQSGISLDTVTSATTKLANNIVGGNKSAVAALEKLGFNMDSLKRMKPEDQFIAVADAVGKIQNPTEKTYAAMQVFGKGGAELLAGLTGNLKQTTDEFEKMGLIIDEETLVAADQFGDQLGVMGRQLLGVVANIVGPLLPALSGLANLLGKVGGVVGSVTGFFVDWIQKGLVAAYSAIARFVAWVADAATKIPILGKHLGFASEAADWLRKSADDADQYLVKLFTSTTDVGKAAATTTPEMIGLGEATERNAKATRELKKAQDEAANRAYLNYLGEARMAAEAAALAQEGYLRALRERTSAPAMAAGAAMPEPGLGGLMFDTREMNLRSIAGARAAQAGFLAVMKETGQQVPSALIPPPAHSVWQGAFRGFGDMFRTQLPQTIMAAFTGGGDVFKSVGGLFGGQLTRNIFGSEGMQKSITSVFGATLGGAFNAILPGIGALAGPLISGIAGLFDGLFGPSKKEKEGRSAAAAFRDELAGALTESQKLEVQSAVNAGQNERWAATVIFLRDRYRELGLTEAEALQDADRLWRAEREGGEAVGRVIADINSKTGGLATTTRHTTTTAVRGFNEARAALDVFKTDVADPAAWQRFEQMLHDAAAAGVTDFSFLFQMLDQWKREAATPIRIPIEFQWHDLSLSRASERAEAAGMSEADKRRTISGFLADNPGDRHRIPSALGISAEEAERLGFHRGGWVRAHQGLWSDEVRAILQTGERVLSRAEVATMGGRGRVDALAAGGGGGIVVVVMDQNGHMRPGDAEAREIARKVIRLLPEELQRSGLRVH